MVERRNSTLKNRLAMFCMAVSIGALCATVHSGKWDASLGWVAALAYSTAWKFEVGGEKTEEDDGNA